jgi:hypothetical protein
MAGYDVLPTSGDLVESLFPADGCEIAPPLGPRRFSGVVRRSGEFTNSASRLTLAQAKPAVKG